MKHICMTSEGPNAGHDPGRIGYIPTDLGGVLTLPARLCRRCGVWYSSEPVERTQPEAITVKTREECDRLYGEGRITFPEDKEGVPRFTRERPTGKITQRLHYR